MALKMVANEDKLPLPIERENELPLWQQLVMSGPSAPEKKTQNLPSPIDGLPILQSVIDADSIPLPGGVVKLSETAAERQNYVDRQNELKLPLATQAVVILGTAPPLKKSRLNIVRAVSLKPIPDNGWSIERLSFEATPPGWENVFAGAKDEIKQISDLITKDEITYGMVVPDRINMYKSLHECSLAKVRVVILGQDPYHTIQDNGSPIAEGMSFSVPLGVRIPPSLQNIFKELATEYPPTCATPFRYPTHGHLGNWARQGVLLLNACLTTRAGVAGAHSKFMLWMPFVTKILNAIGKTNSQCIYVMWGAEAQKLQRYIDGKRVLTASHPSPFSASKGFFGCNHFRKINEMLGTNPIDWNL